MGFSRVPFDTDSLILNFVMKSISSQFHVVFNDMFTPVHFNHDMELDTWHQLITSPNCCLQVVNAYNPDLSDEWLTIDKCLLQDNMQWRNAVQSL
jgi:hypothetical protein